MKSLYALLTCAGIALTAAGCPQETTTPTTPDNTPDLGTPTPMDNSGSTTGAPDTGTSEAGGSETGASDTGAPGETSDTGTEGTATEGPSLPAAGDSQPQ